MSPRASILALAAATLLLAGCGEEKVSVYRVPKEKEPEAAMAANAPGMGEMAAQAVPTAGGGGLDWDVPSTWKSKPPSEMRKASYDVPGGCDLSVTAFPGDVGGELANVNRWRGQVGLAELRAEELDAAVSRFEANGLRFCVADMRSGDQADARAIVGASVPFGDSTWFFKLSGPAPAVAAAKPQFLGFLRTVRAP